MPVKPFFGKYCRFTSTTTEGDYALMGADCLVGDLFKICIQKTEDGDRVAKVKSKFNQEIGELDQDTSRKILLLQADGWEIRSILASVVFFADDDGGGLYGGEIVIISFPKRYEREFGNFTLGVASEIADGKRPTMKLSEKTVESIIKADGMLVPKDSEPRLRLSKGSFFVKDHMKADEKMVEMARKRNPGCMAVGWIFIIALIALGLFILYRIAGAFL